MFENLVFAPEDRILEVGCGPGNWAAWASRQVPRGEVWAVDVDSAGIDWNRKNFPKKDYPNLEFVCSDARTLDFHTEPFDYVMTRACLHYLDHPGEAFPALARHLKPGGKLCLICLGKGNLNTLYKALEKTMSADRWRPHFEGFQRHGSRVDGVSCDSWLRDAGLQRKQSRLLNEPLAFNSRQAFQEWFSFNFSQYFKPIPDSQRAEFIGQVVDAYCGRAQARNGVSANRVWLQLEAVKT